MHRFSSGVRHGDSDKMGVACDGSYLRWFEVERAEKLRSLGLSCREVKEGGPSCP